MSVIFIALQAVPGPGRAAETEITAPSVSRAVPSAEALRGDLAKFDAALEVMRDKAAFPPSLAMLYPDPDFRNRRLSDDWRDFILSPEAISDMTLQRARVVHDIDSGELSTAAADLVVLNGYGRAEAGKVKPLLQYWQKVGAHPPNWQPYLAMLRSNGIDPRYVSNGDSLERTFRLQVSHGLFSDAMTVTWPKLLDIQVRAAHFGSEALQALSDATRGLYSLNRVGECSPVAGTTSGEPKVKRDPSLPTPPAHYPDSARGHPEEGDALVGMLVSKQGCVSVASIFGSTGYEDLDRAAVKEALALRFLPAIRDGAAIELVTMFPIKYKLSNSY